MKKLYIILFVIYFSIIFADEPPGWSEYSKTTNNGRFIANISTPNKMKSYNSEWFLTVSDSIGTTLFHRKFIHDGYSSTIISENGKYFIDIREWYDKDGLVYIYSKDDLKIVSNKEIKLWFFQLQKTASHKIWIDKYYIENDIILVLDLILGQIKKINLETGELVR